MKVIVHSLLLWAIGSGALAVAQQPQASAQGRLDSSFEAGVKPFLAKNCGGCHNAKLKTAGLDLTRFDSEVAADTAPEVWEKALEKLRQGAMPPQPLPRPKQADIDVAIKWMESSLVRADATAKPDPGRITAHRLNRVEYNNTVRDLLGVDVHPADDFPQDDSGYGFDNNGDVLSLSPVLTERYLSAAEKVVQAALHGPEKLKPSVVRHQAPSREFPVKKMAVTDYDESGLSMPNALHVTHRIPVEADYTFRVALDGKRPLGSMPVTMAIWIDGKQAGTVSVNPPPTDKFGSEFLGTQREFQVHLPAGDHWLAASILKVYEGLPTRYNGPNPSHMPDQPPPTVDQLMKVKAGATPEQTAALRQKTEERLKKSLVPANRVYVRYIEVLGPYNQHLGPNPASRQLLFASTKGSQSPAAARLVLTRFARRAFRRPVSETEIQPYETLYKESRDGGASFDDSLGTAFEAILVSPDFLFRIEPRVPAIQASTRNSFPSGNLSGAGRVQTVAFRNTSVMPDLPPSPAVKTVDADPIGEYALASRLSYFLWSTMPDDELMRYAAAGTLHQPAVLKGQVDRMLRSPRSLALAENFAGQWLELRKLESVAPDRERFPLWDDYLRMSMQRETTLFFDNLVRQDGSVLDLLDSKTTFINQKLAEFYGIKGVKGPEFRAVNLEGTHRSGVLTQGSVLTVSSYATRTSPVIRGKWVLENFLNATIPPPPPNVPRLNEEQVGQSASVRQQMEAHRSNPMCAGCHTKMDPIGFSFENFSAIGQWRDTDGKFPIDASGKLPSGQTFNGAQELEAIYRKDPRIFVECVTDKLMTYALGRGMERFDRPTVKAIAAHVAEHNYQFSDLVLQIVNSLPFEMSRRGDRT